MAWLWTLMRPWAMIILRIVFRIKVVGAHFVPKKGPAILASNHLSAIDHLVLPAVTRRVIINISKAEHFENPVKAWFFRQWGVIPLKRGTGDNAAIETAKEQIRAGNLFAIYPEGTRSLDGNVHKGHTGVARLALELKVPIIPVAMVGTFEAKPKGGKLRLFTPCAAVVGEPMVFEDHWGKQGDRAVCREVTDQVMHKLAELAGKPYIDGYQHNPEVPGYDRGSSAKNKGSGAGESGDDAKDGGKQTVHATA